MDAADVVAGLQREDKAEERFKMYEECIYGIT